MVAGKAVLMSWRTGFAVSTEVPKSPVTAFSHVDPELLVERPVQAELEIDPVVGALGRPVADDRQHRIDRHDRGR